MKSRERYILMLEDDGDDRHITETFFAEQNYNIRLEFLTNPGEMISYLDRCYQEGILLPSLIILDKYVPAGSGIEVLKAIKAHPVFHQIPTVMISGSDHEEDIEESYRLGANSYIIKPFRSEFTIKKISTFVTYWFEVAELPMIAVNKEEANYSR